MIFEVMILATTGVIFLLSAIAMSFFPYEIQKITLKRKWLKKWDSDYDRIKTSDYILELRIGGIVSFFVFFLVLYVLIKKVF